MDFKAALQFLATRPSYEDLVVYRYDKKSFDLGRMQRAIELWRLDLSPLRFLHVAGSKGKGTVSHLLAGYLAAEGKEVGLFTSPYVDSVRECFWFDGQLISEADFERLVGRVAVFLEEEEVELTYFEVLTFMVLIYFVEVGAGFVVLEVGMGGRLDATNVVSNKLVTVLTRVEKEHQEVLGESVEEILGEQLGIGQEGTPWVIGAQEAEVLALVKEKLKEREYYLTESGPYQSALAENVVTAALALEKAFGAVDERRLGSVAAELVLPGRVEWRELSSGKVLFDMAHTPSSFANLVGYLKREFPHKKYLLVISIMKGKQLVEMLQKLIPLGDFRVCFTKTHPQRSVDPEDLLAVFSKISDRSAWIGTWEEAQKTLEEDEILVLTGTHFHVLTF